MLYVVRKRGARYVLLPMAVLILSVGVVACGQTTTGSSPGPTTAPTTAATSQPSIAAITITAVDFSYTLPQTVPAGLVDITFVNSGTQLHQAQLVQLNSGVTYDQFHSALLQKGLLVMRTLGKLMGGPNITAPGKSSEVMLNLPAGQYVAMCPIPAKDGVRQYLKGMITSFTVSAPANNAQPAAPTATGQVTLKSFSIGLPTTVSVGAVTWQVMNTGQEPYEFNVVKLAPGKTAQDVSVFLLHPSGPPPFINIGGMAAISPGLSGWVKFNLTAGTYVALSQVLDKATGKPDFTLGMLTSFTVQ
ncbi:MAG TPA: hypothetical protein VKR83_14680 [Ktedonobacteraceae bacterium]|nr:hypothetical protein [Ktedonobacteraceae bacterium]